MSARDEIVELLFSRIEHFEKLVEPFRVFERIALPAGPYLVVDALDRIAGSALGALAERLRDDLLL